MVQASGWIYLYADDQIPVECQRTWFQLEFPLIILATGLFFYTFEP